MNIPDSKVFATMVTGALQLGNTVVMPLELQLMSFCLLKPSTASSAYYSQLSTYLQLMEPDFTRPSL